MANPHKTSIKPHQVPICKRDRNAWTRNLLQLFELILAVNNLWRLLLAQLHSLTIMPRHCTSTAPYRVGAAIDNDAGPL